MKSFGAVFARSGRVGERGAPTLRAQRAAEAFTREELLRAVSEAIEA